MKSRLEQMEKLAQSKENRFFSFTAVSCLLYLIFLFCINRSSAPPTQSHRTEATNQVTLREVVLDRGTHKRKQTPPMSASNVPPNPVKRAAVVPTAIAECMEDIKPVLGPRYSFPVAPAFPVMPPIRTYQRASAKKTQVSMYVYSWKLIVKKSNILKDSIIIIVLQAPPSCHCPCQRYTSASTRTYSNSQHMVSHSRCLFIAATTTTEASGSKSV